VKARIIVWALVALAVIGVALLFATSGKQPVARRTLESYKAEAERLAWQLDRVVQRVNELRTGAGANAELGRKLDEVIRLEADARAKVAQVRSAADTKQAVQFLKQARQSAGKVRRALDLAVGPRRPGGR
jgi:hypothetical protein